LGHIWSLQLHFYKIHAFKDQANPVFAFHFPTGGKTANAAAFGHELLQHAHSFVVRPLSLSFPFFEEGGGEVVNLRYLDLKSLVAKYSGYEDFVFF